MEKIVDNERMMFRVCDLYYNRDISQSEIAKIMDLSRPTVAKLLKSARQRRIVEITISDPQNRRYSELERRLEKTYGLKEVIVADATDEEHQKEALGKVAAGYLKSILDNDMVIGVGMGTTLRYVAPYATDQFRNLTFIPLIGGSIPVIDGNDVDVTLDANIVADVLAKAFGGYGMHLYVPAIVSHVNSKRTFLREEMVRKVMDMYDKLDVALVGIGTGDGNSSVFRSGYYTPEMIEKVKEADACGDICMHLFDRKGNINSIEYNKQVFGIKLNKLKKIPYAIGIASGTRKAEAIQGAINGGYINVLITDASCAQALLDLDR